MGCNLYNVPRCYIAGFVGEFGSGKSLILTRQGLYSANYLQKSIVANYRIRVGALKEYCRMLGLNYLLWAIYNKKDFIIYEPDPDKILHFDNSIILFDEINQAFFSRDFARTSRTQLDRFWRIRHFGNRLYYTAQGKEQIDKQVRERTQIFGFCKSIQNPVDEKIWWKWVFYFGREAFEKFSDKVGLNKVIYPYWASSFRVEQGLLNQYDQQLFKIYSSADFSRGFLVPPKYRFVGHLS